MQRPSPRFRSEQFTYLGYSEKCFTRIYRTLYGDATLLPIRMGTNMAAKNQQKHLSMSSTSTVWIIQVRDKLVSRGSYRHLSNNSSNKRTVQICSDSKISQNESLFKPTWQITWSPCKCCVMRKLWKRSDFVTSASYPTYLTQKKIKYAK